MVDLFLGSAILIAAAGAGRMLLRMLRAEPADRAEALVFSLALGLGLLSYSVFILGSFGFLNRWLFVILLAAVFFGTSASWMPMRRAFSWPKEGLKRIVAILCLFIAAFALCGVLAPPTGQDELCYHLVQPANYVRAHAVYEVPFSTNSLWPYLMEMLFTLGLLIHGPELAKFFHFSMYLITAGAAGCFVRRFGPSKHAFWSAAIFLATPAAFMQAAFAYVDSALAAYILLCCYALLIYAETGGMGWAAAAGLLAGFAASVKLLGLFALPLAVLIFAGVWISRKKMAVRGAMVFAACLILGGGVWYLRSAILRGNPVFPFYPQFFGGHGWLDPTYVGVHGRGGGLLSFLALPWDLTLHPDWFGGEHIGPLYLALLPLIFLERPWRPQTKTLLVWVLGYSLMWYVVDPNIRFFFPALTLLAAVLGPVLGARLEERGTAGVLTRAAFLSFFLFAGALAGYHFRDEAALFLHGDAKAYLLEHERSYPVAQVVNARLSRGDKILSTGESRGYYFDQPFVAEGEFESFTHYDRGAASAAEVMARLKAEGFTHVLSSSLEDESAAPPQGLRVQSLLKDPAQRQGLFREEAGVRVGRVRYILYRIL